MNENTTLLESLKTLNRIAWGMDDTLTAAQATCILDTLMTAFDPVTELRNVLRVAQIQTTVETN